MAAYIIVDIDIHDPEIYEEYKRLAPASIAKYGGKYLTRGGKTEVLEGDWGPKRLVILHFESMQRAKDWLHSMEYEHPKKLRHRSARSNMILTEGI